MIIVVVYIVLEALYHFSFAPSRVCGMYLESRCGNQNSAKIQTPPPIIMLKDIISRLLSLGGKFQGIIVFVTGPEGSGKTTLAHKVAEAYEGTAVVPFSKVLEDFLEYKSSHKDTDRRDLSAIKQAKDMMKRRSKNIKHCLLCSALRHALINCCCEQKLIVVEGWLRREKQCQDTLQIVAECFPKHLLVCVEATCDRQSAFERALSRKQEHDQAEFLKNCHDEYWSQLDTIRKACSWAHRLEISTEGSPEETLENLTIAFNKLELELTDREFVKTTSSILGIAA